MIQIQSRIRIRIREAQKHVDPDPQHWYILTALCAGPRQPDLRAKDGGGEAWRSRPRRQAGERLQGWFFCQRLTNLRNKHLLFLENLNVPPGQIGSAREWNHWIGLEKNINRYRF
jgi:hypothetical protein